ncbi:hypothetical protein [Streptomyces sp. NPDC088348]|uniref:hypothetical protein n=1 Tax=Streptomyces sp. NPDC088348 TaxID=3365853 RepID=UPI0037FF3D3D
MADLYEAYYEIYSEDFGLSGLTVKFSSSGPPMDEFSASAMVAATANEFDGGYADELRDDVNILLESPVTDDALGKVWLAATRCHFNPDTYGMDSRTWLRKVLETCGPGKPRGKIRVCAGIPPKHQHVVNNALLSGVVLGEIHFIADDLAHQMLTVDHGVPGIVPALEQVVAQTESDLGFRLFLRALKAYSVQVGEEQYDRLMELGERFGFPAPLVHDGLNVYWPPLPLARRRFEDDFGFSFLTRRFDGPWEREHTVEEMICLGASTGTGAPPGAQAYLVLADTLRLLESDLSPDALTTLWLAASGRGYNIDHLGIDGRDWLCQITEVSREQLRKDAGPDAPTPDVSEPASMEHAQVVLRALREVLPALEDRIHRHDWSEVNGAGLALEQVVTSVDPDLGFRLLLGVLRAYHVPITGAQYAQFQMLGDLFGYGRFHISANDVLIEC